MEIKELKNIVEAALLASGEPLTIDALCGLFGKGEEEAPPKEEIREAIKALQEEYEDRGIQLKEVASGFRVQVGENMSPWLQKLWEERPPRYSRALMETLAIIAYRQPLTRGDIEDIRGVAVSTNIIRSLLDRQWIRPVGQRDVPGRPTLYATTKQFLDYFGLKKLEELPPLAELAELDPVNVQLELDVPKDEKVLQEGVAPGAAEPLVSPAEVNELPEEPASVTSLDEVREAAAAEEAEASEEESAGVEVELDADDADDETAEAAAEESEELVAEAVGAEGETPVEVAEDSADDDSEEEPASATVVPLKQS